MSPLPADTQFATSADGTRIAYAAAGTGPPLVVVEGALGHRRLGAAKALSKALTNRLTWYAYDRRGRGDSEPGRSVYECQREVEDLGAVIAAAGGTAAVLGHSSGGALALETARQGVEMAKLIVYEAPFIVDGSHEPTDPDLAEKLQSIVDDRQRSDAVKLFLNVAGVPAPIIAVMRLTPSWKQRTAVAHTLPYDVSIVIGFRQGKPLPRRVLRIRQTRDARDRGREESAVHAPRASCDRRATAARESRDPGRGTTHSPSPRDRTSAPAVSDEGDRGRE